MRAAIATLLVGPLSGHVLSFAPEVSYRLNGDTVSDRISAPEAWR